MRRPHPCLWVVVFLLLSGSLPARGANQGEELIEKRAGSRLQPQVIEPSHERVQSLKLPEGFRIGLYAKDLGEPRMMAVGEDGTLYVTRRKPGDVLALRDSDGDGRADDIRTVIQGLLHVHGIAVKGDKMYLCTVDALYVATLGEKGAGEPRRILGDLPPGGMHPNRTIGVGPDGMLYISIGSTCNCCFEAHSESATLVRVRADGSGREVFAAGLRNTVGFGWHPTTHEMYGMDNGSDWLGDLFPPEELNLLQRGEFYGWPLVNGQNQMIRLKHYPPDFDAAAYLKRSTPAVLEYTAHAAPIQMAFYTGKQFPKDYKGDAFVALHGSWNRTPPVGYEVVRIHFEDGRPKGFEPFLSGFLVLEEGDFRTFGRPSGLAVAADGALLVGCDQTGAIYRISYGR